MNTKQNQKIWIEKIQKNLLLRGRSEKTYINYRCALIKFFNYYDETINIKRLKENDIIDFLNYEYLIPNKSKNSYNLAVSSIKLFYLVCFNTSLNNLLLPSSKIAKRLPVIISKNEFLLFLNNETNIKHKCWLLLGFCSGLRVEEVAHLRIENIFPSEHKIKVLGKGNKERYTLLPDITIKILRLYCKKYNITNKEGYLFYSHKDTPIPSSETITNYFTNLMKQYNKLGIYTFHSLRHSFATYYLSNGGSLLALQSMLGHKSLSTTAIYVHLAHDFNNLKGINYGK